MNANVSRNVNCLAKHKLVIHLLSGEYRSTSAMNVIHLLLLAKYKHFSIYILNLVIFVVLFRI